MSKLVMLRGLPSSGKSTRAREIIEKNGNFVRLNKDCLRDMLHNKWTWNTEKITKKVERIIAKELLQNNINIIVDDTNLGEKHKESWKNLCEEIGAKFVIENLSKKIDLKELFERDEKRENTVGRHVILELALQYDLIGPRNFGDGSKKWIVCDIDGTIANLKHRLPFVKNTEKKDWKAFFNAMSEDKVISKNVKLIREYQKEGYPIIFVSGRPDSHRDVTKEWIENTAFKSTKFIEGEDYATILMRRSIEHKPDNEVKEDILKTYLKPENVHLVIDDRPRVIEMWRSYDIEVVDVGSGIDF